MSGAACVSEAQLLAGTLAGIVVGIGGTLIGSVLRDWLNAVTYQRGFDAGVKASMKVDDEEHGEQWA